MLHDSFEPEKETVVCLHWSSTNLSLKIRKWLTFWLCFTDPHNPTLRAVGFSKIVLENDEDGTWRAIKKKKITDSPLRTTELEVIEADSCDTQLNDMLSKVNVTNSCVFVYMAMCLSFSLFVFQS